MSGANSFAVRPTICSADRPISLAMAGLELIGAMKMKRLESYGFAMAAAIIGAQAAFLVHGDRFARIWEITEYKELFIALGLFVWKTVGTGWRTHQKLTGGDQHHVVRD